MRNNSKLFIPILAAVFLLFGGFILAGAANPPPQATADPPASSVNGNPIIALPLVNKNYCSPEIIESPFTIQIAALHHITTTNATAQTIDQAQIYAWYEQAFPTLVSALEDSGAGYTRIYIRWFDIEPNAPLPGQPPVYNWQWYDDRLIQIAQAGIKMIATIGAAPAWAGDSKVCPPISSSHQTDYVNFLTALVNRYSQPPYNIKHWEIFNEADNTTDSRAESHACFGLNGANYAQILSLSYPVIKSIDPQATVLMSGVAYDWFTPSGPFNRYFPDEVMSAGGASKFDALNFHYFPDFHLEWERWVPQGDPPTCGTIDDGQGQPYDGSGIDVIAKKNHYTNRMKVCFGVNKPVWLTELAEHGVIGDEISLRDQAYYVIKGYTRGLAAGIKNITWFSLATPQNDIHDQSLLYADLTPKPAFNTYKNLVAQLTDYKYNRTITLPGGEAYVFSNRCQGEKIVAWGNNVPLTVSPAKALEVTDYLGVVTPIQDGGAGDLDGTPNGSIQVLLSARDPNPVPEPVFIRVTSK